MLQRSASRVLSASQRSWQSSMQLTGRWQNFNRSYGVLSQFRFSSASPSFVDNRKERPISKYDLPRISILERQSLSSPTRRYKSTSSTTSATTTTTTTTTSDEQTSMRERYDVQRERFDEQRDRSREAASKGAHSLKEMTKQYGPVFLGTYLTVYASTLAALFAGIQSGAVDPAYLISWVSDASEAPKSTVETVKEFLEHYPWTSPLVPVVEAHPEVANLGVAWIMVKFTEPIRLGMTVAIVPRLARHFGFAPPKELSEEAAEKVEDIASPPEKISPSSDEETSTKKV